MKTEKQTRQELINHKLLQSGRDVLNHSQVSEEFADTSTINNDTQQFSDYVLLAQNGKPLAVVEAKKTSKDARLGREQAKQYCENIKKEAR